MVYGPGNDADRLARLLEALRAAGIQQPVEWSEAEPGLATPEGAPLLLVRADAVLSSGLLADLVADPRGPAVTLEIPAAIRVDGSARRLLAGSVTGGDLVQQTLAALSAAGVEPAVVPTGGYVARLPADAAEAEAALAAADAVDEEAVRVGRSVKTKDSPFTTYLVSPWSRYLARWAGRRGFSPNQMTVVSLLLGLAAAGAFATGDRPGLVAGALLLQVSFVFDCLDGQLARYVRRYSDLGAWLDSTFDRVKEYAVYAGLAIGSARHGRDVWILAAAALGLQVYRHSVAFGYEQRGAPDAGAPLARLAVSASARTSRVKGVDLVKRSIVLPIGERWAVLCVAAAVADARAAFYALLVAGGFAALYTTAGRVLRTAGSG